MLYTTVFAVYYCICINMEPFFSSLLQKGNMERCSQYHNKPVFKGLKANSISHGSLRSLGTSDNNRKSRLLIFVHQLTILQKTTDSELM